MTKCLIPLLAIIFSCVSVPVIANPTCAIKLNNDLHQHLMFDHTNGQDVNLTIINQSACEVRALAVGGGGQFGNGCGAGSGYLQYVRVQVEASTTQVYLNVGDRGQKSYMMIGGCVGFVQFYVPVVFLIWAHFTNLLPEILQICGKK